MGGINGGCRIGRAGLGGRRWLRAGGAERPGKRGRPLSGNRRKTGGQGRQRSRGVVQAVLQDLPHSRERRPRVGQLSVIQAWNSVCYRRNEEEYVEFESCVTILPNLFFPLVILCTSDE